MIYQVYPRSLQDTNEDGVGDLKGILERLDYFAAIGVDAIWISPIYTSPMADFGYDVADYTGIDPLFGTMNDFDTLLAATHERGLKLILDFVPNHSSDQHPWFVDSRSSKASEHSDWYLWHDPAPPAGESDQRPARERLPNNWRSHFSGPAWTWDETRQQFYMHSFLPQQPDLNWRNPVVKQAIFDAMRFWLDKGVDGFRMDVLWLLIKDDEFRNNPPNPEFRGQPGGLGEHLPKYTADQPGTHEIVREMRALMDSYAPPRSRVLIGEIYLPLAELVRYYGAEKAPARQPEELAAHATREQGSEVGGTPHLAGADLPFNFHLILTPWKAAAIAKVITTYEDLLPAGAWPNYVLGNHDQPRLATRVGAKQARVAQMLLLTLRGTPTLYYGDELAMPDAQITPEQVRDPAELRNPGGGQGRDPERSPMIWSAEANAGFCAEGVAPWLPLVADWQTLNAATQGSDPRSILSLTRALLHMRRHLPALHGGSIEEVQTSGSVLCYVRRATLVDGSTQRLQVLLNLGDDEQVVPCEAGTLFLTTLMDGAGAAISGSLTLEGGEGVLLALDEPQADA